MTLSTRDGVVKTSRELHRVLVTGIGAITPIGNDVPSFWDGLSSGSNGISRVTLCDPDGLPVQIAGEVKNFDPEQYLERRTARRTGRFAQFAVAAGREALQDAGLLNDSELQDDIGVVMATSGDAFEMGAPYADMQKRGPMKADPFIITRSGQHMGAARVARELGLRGPNTTINTACASGTDALGHALNLIRLGQANALIAGGTEAIIGRLALASMGRLGALSRNNTDPEHACRPFDKDRDGFVLGEGAGVLLLESETSAQNRGARVYAELAGAGWSFDATDDTAPDPEGEALAMQRAMTDADIDPSDVDYINAHGTSTQYNDRSETRAVKLALGEKHASQIMISSTKSMTGHLAAGAGGIEAIAALLALYHGCIPPTINYQTPDPDCDLNIVVNEARPAELNVVLSNSFGLGGQNACIAFRRYAS